MPLEIEQKDDIQIQNKGPYRRPITILGRRGPNNPTPDDITDEYFIEDYWLCPEFFDIEMIGENERWGLEFIKGEMGALKRYLVHLSMFGSPTINIDPFSVLVCIENLQRYYKKKIKELKDKNGEIVNKQTIQEDTK